MLEGDDSTLGWTVTERVNEATLQGWVLVRSSVYLGGMFKSEHPHPAYNDNYTFRSTVRKPVTLGSERMDCSIVT